MTFIAADESYLILDSEREGDYGESNLFISFRQEDGSWGAAKIWVQTYTLHIKIYTAVPHRMQNTSSFRP